MVECSVLCGVFDSLARVTVEDDEVDHYGPDANDPSHISECRKTLDEIHHILIGFERKAASVSTQPKSR